MSELKNGKSDIELIIDVMSQMMDNQIETAKSTTKMNELLSDSNAYLEKMNGYFSNGFRSEIKEHTTEKIKELSIEISQLRKEVSKFIEMLKSPRYWATIIVGAITAISTLMFAISKIIS